MQIIKNIRFTATVIPLMISSISCNVFSPLDSPASDAQYLSKARACFDQADYACARENYAKITDVDSLDAARSEQVFALLDENGVNLGNFLSSIVGNDAGFSGILTGMTKGFIENNTASAATRQKIFLAYLSALQIQDSSLRGLAKFLTSAALVGEILAEDAGDDGIFDASDVVNDSDSCLASNGPPTQEEITASVAAATLSGETATLGGCFATSCAKPTGKILTTGDAAVDIDTLTDIGSSDPSFRIIISAIGKIQTSLSEIIGTSTDSGSLTDAISSADDLGSDLTSTTDLTGDVDGDGDVDVVVDYDRCYRYAVISLLFGTN